MFPRVAVDQGVEPAAGEVDGGGGVVERRGADDDRVGQLAGQFGQIPEDHPDPVVAGEGGGPVPVAVDHRGDLDPVVAAEDRQVEFTAGGPAPEQRDADFLPGRRPGRVRRPHGFPLIDRHSPTPPGVWFGCPRHFVRRQKTECLSIVCSSSVMPCFSR
jgi:hypothetical protein